MTRSVEYFERGGFRVRRGTAEEADARADAARLAALEDGREQRRREFEEHHRLTRDLDVLHGVTRRVHETAKRLVRQANPLGRKKGKTKAEKREPYFKAVREAMGVSASVSDNHVLVPVAAINKAALADELHAVSLHIQGHILAMRGGVATYGQGPSRGPLIISAERRSQLIAMNTYANERLAPELREMADLIVSLTVQAVEGRLPTISEIGGRITASEDERVRKGGVIGHWRAVFQSVAHQQRNFLIEEAARRKAPRRIEGR